jgi:AP-4 complex subunit mu-1
VVSLFFLLGPRGDIILFRDFRGECGVSPAVEAFHRNVQFQALESPVFNVQGTNFIFLRRAGMYFVVATRHNASPNILLEFLTFLVSTFRSFCGVLSEEALRVNFFLLYELLDEIIDAGHIQCTDVTQLKHSVLSEPIVPVDLLRRAGGSKKTLAATASSRPIGLSRAPRSGGPVKKGGEIFIDVVERLTAFLVLLQGQPVVSSASVEGSVFCKSYLVGKPWMRVALARDLQIGARSASGGAGASSGGGGGGGRGPAVLDDMNFHGCVNTEDLDSKLLLHVLPPEGEFTLINYRALCRDTGAMPLRVYPTLLDDSVLRAGGSSGGGSSRVELVLRLACELPLKQAVHNITLRFSVPPATATVWPQVQKEATGTPASAHAVDYAAKNKCVIWKVARLQGGQSATLRTRITLTSVADTLAGMLKSMGPVTLEFEAPDCSITNFRVRLGERGVRVCACVLLCACNHFCFPPFARFYTDYRCRAPE